MENNPVEHTFDNHAYCDSTWCYKLQVQRNNTCYVQPLNCHFYIKVRNKKVNKQLNEIFERFKKIDVIAESIHSLATQSNEALNMVSVQACPNPNVWDRRLI